MGDADTGNDHLSDVDLPSQSALASLAEQPGDDAAKRHIEYFDSHILHSLDHVRALYYPSYAPSELVGGVVTLDLNKALPKKDGKVDGPRFKAEWNFCSIAWPENDFTRGVLLCSAVVHSDSNTGHPPGLVHNIVHHLVGLDPVALLV